MGPLSVYTYIDQTGRRLYSCTRAGQSSTMRIFKAVGIKIVRQNLSYMRIQKRPARGQSVDLSTGH
jgi:hypothetical protein